MRVFQSFPRSQIKIVIAFFGSEPSADSCSAAKSHGAASQIDPTEKEHKIACSMTPGHNGMSASGGGKMILTRRTAVRC
jgi:hypothetical protein